MMISNCCGANAHGHLDEDDMLGMCSDCFEWAEFYDEDEDECSGPSREVVEQILNSYAKD